MILVSPARVDWFWALAKPHLERVLKRGHGSYAPDDVLARCRTGQYRLWLADGAAMVTELCDYPRKRTCIVRMLGGKSLPQEWRGYLSLVEEWAREQGCSAMEVFGRKGWARKLDGYDLQQVVLRKELCPVCARINAEEDEL